MQYDSAGRLIEYATRLGASYLDIRYQDVASEVVTVENGVLKSFESGRTSGAGIRTIVNGAMGFSSDTDTAPSALREKVRWAVKMAKASAMSAEPKHLATVNPVKDSVRTPFKIDPEDVPNEEKVSIAMDANKEAMLGGEIRNSTSRLGWFHEHRHFISSEGSSVDVETVMVGLSQLSVALVEGRMERVYDGESLCKGFEFIEGRDWNAFSRDVSEMAVKATRASTPPAGVYGVVVDPELIGLVLHEAFGHASEGDLVTTKESVLEGRIGQRVASPLVTIVDDGYVEGGYFLPYDDEGAKKTRQVVVEEGILKGFLHSRETAQKLGVPSSGNGRAQDFESPPIVRQTNYFLESGDQTLEEMVEDVKDGLYICGRGAGGGQVDVGLGTFTFRAGPSYTIKNGRLGELVRGVSISGAVLQTLMDVEAVGKDLSVRTSFFGGCGKSGQRARVGHGGPHTKIRRMIIGGGG